jgi:Hypoxia induced protein conserved region
MKILTKEEEQAHYYATLKGGSLGGFAGLGLGLAAVGLASRRYHFMHNLTLPLKAFLVTSAGTFTGIVSADHYSRKFEAGRNPKQVEFEEKRKRDHARDVAGKSWTERAIEFGRQERYKIVVGSWVGSMFAAFAIVNRNKYLTGAQKLVQARVYAQFLTLGVLVASAAFEIADSRNQEGRWETVRYVDPKDPEHKRMLEKRVERDPGVGMEKEDPENRDMWKTMVKEEEERLKERDEYRKEVEKEQHKKHPKGNGNGKGKKDEGGKGEKKDEGKKDSGKEEKKDDKSEKKEKK